MVTMRYKYRVVITFKDIPLQQGLKLHLRADGLELRRAFKDIPLQLRADGLELRRAFKDIPLQQGLKHNDFSIFRLFIVF